MRDETAVARTAVRVRWNPFSTDHRQVGISYLVLSVAAVAVGVVLSLLMRLHLAWPDVMLPFFGAIKPEDYLALVTMHGTLMVFFVLTTAPQNGFGNIVIPAQIGAGEMAFPGLNLASFWVTCAGFFVVLGAFCVAGGAPIAGWTSYPPFSAIPSTGPGQGLGMDLWLISIALFCVGGSMAAVNMLTTVVRRRCAGMTMGRIPLTVWAWFVSSMLILLSFSVLLAALVLLFCDRHFGTSFYVPASEVVNGQLLRRGGDGTPLLWLHLFWFFGHPEVYIAILPGMGLTSMLVMNFTRRRVPSYRSMISTTILIGLLGFLVWGHHMFVSGMNPYAGGVFALTTMAIAIPSSAKVLVWLGTLLRGGVQRRPDSSSPTLASQEWGTQIRREGHIPAAMLFVLGFISFFVAGGLTGPVLAQPNLDSYLHNTFFVVAHFHLIMAMAGVFGMFAAAYYWFPLVNGRLMNERLGRWHFWLTLVGGYFVFFPMHFAGMAGQPRHFSELTGTTWTTFAHLIPLHRWISVWAFVLAGAQVLFFVNLQKSLRRGRMAGANPWAATTLEWFPGTANARPVVHCSPDEYGVEHEGRDFRAQWEPLPEEE